MHDVRVAESLALTAHHVMFSAKNREQIRFATQMWLTALFSETLHQTAV